MRRSFARAGGSSSTMSTRVSVMAFERQLDRHARTPLRTRLDAERVIVRIHELEAATHVGQTDARRVIAAQTHAVVLDRAAQARAVGLDAHIDAPLPARQPVTECVLDERLQQQARYACIE